MENGLRRLIVGQDEAIRQIVDVYQMHLTGMCSPDRPIGNFLFLGPTGSGKTRIVEATAETLLDTSRAVIKVDCAEFQHSHEIAKLIGSPPGYLGHRETHPMLSQEVLNQFHTDSVRLSFVLFDEIEKASDALWNLLLGILDKASLTLGDNRRVDFSQSLIFMTSNIGATEMSSILNPRLGFGVSSSNSVVIAEQDFSRTGKKLERSGIEAARRKFSPEFFNRLDKVVVFQPLGRGRVEADSRDRVGNGATTDLPANGGSRFCIHHRRLCQVAPAPGRDRHKIWRAALETGHRAASRAAHFELVGHRPDPPGRLGEGCLPVR